MLAAAVAHQQGFLNAAEKNGDIVNATSAMTFSQRLVSAVRNEVYPLRRWGGLQFPPDVTGKEILIKASVVKDDERPLQGTLVAHGGKENGYGVFIQNGKIHLVVKQNSKAYIATSSRSLPRKFDMTAELTVDGVMRILVDGKQAGSGKAPGIFERPLGHGLRTGRDLDDENKMSRHEGEFHFTGNFHDAVLELKNPDRRSAAKKMLSKMSASASDPGSVTINIKVVKDIMQFDTKEIRVRAGQKVTLVLENPDGMQHNLVIVKPGELETVGHAADLMARDPKAAEKHYVPQIPEVLHATRLVNTGESFVLEFTAPSTPGDYPYVCTFPGHWRGMNGIMKVVESVKASK